jgi:hypothetical protein
MTPLETSEPPFADAHPSKSTPSRPSQTQRRISSRKRGQLWKPDETEKGRPPADFEVTYPNAIIGTKAASLVETTDAQQRRAGTRQF